MFCSKCGSENPDDAKFCGSCGGAIIAATVPPQEEVSMAAPTTSALQTDKPTVSMALKIGVSIATLLIPFIGLIMGIIYLKDKTDESRRAAGKLWLTIGIISAIFNALIMSGNF